jgi:hypothetical protein
MKNADGYKRAIEENLLIVDKNKQEIPFLLNKAQVHFLENSTNRNIILKARKMGFSSLLLAIGLIKFLYGKNERIVSMSFDKEASGKQLERAKRFLDSYQHINKTNFKFKYDSKYEMVLNVKQEDGSSYTNTLRVGTAKSNGFGRGDDITFLHLTEVSLADDIEQLLAGAGEAVVNDAMITMETTANGYNSFKSFWDESVVGSRNYKALFYDPYWEYSKDYVDSKRAELGKLADQEYPLSPEAAFIASGQHYFDTPAIQDYLMFSKNYETEHPECADQQTVFRKYRDFKPGEFVLCFADTAQGGGDYCAAHFLSKEGLDIPLVYHSKTIATEMTPLLHQKLEEIFDQTGVQPIVAFERNNGGLFELERLNKLNRNQKYRIYRAKQNMGATTTVSDSNKMGWDTNSATRPAMLTGIKDAVDNGLLKIYDRPTITEMFSFVEVQTTSSWRAQAERGAHDDLIMSLAGVWQMYQTEKPMVKRNRTPRKKNWAHLQASREGI